MKDMLRNIFLISVVFIVALTGLHLKNRIFEFRDEKYQGLKGGKRYVDTIIVQTTNGNATIYPMHTGIGKGGYYYYFQDESWLMISSFTQFDPRIGVERIPIQEPARRLLITCMENPDESAGTVEIDVHP